MMSHNDDIFDELEDSPILMSIKGKEPFEVPEGYFDKLAGSIQDRLEDELVLKKAPYLQKAGRANIWTVPKKYFEELPGKILARVDGPARIKPLFGKFQQNLAWGLAAAIVLLLAIWLGGKGLQKSDELELANLDEIPQEELYDVLDVAGVDEYDLMALISEDDKLVEEFESESEDEFLKKFGEEEILEELELGDLEDLIMDM